MFSPFSLKVVAQQSSEDWPMFHHDPAHSSAGTGNPVENPTLLWKYTAIGSIESSPAVANGVVYVGSDDDNVYALDAY